MFSRESQGLILRFFLLLGSLPFLNRKAQQKTLAQKRRDFFVLICRKTPL